MKRFDARLAAACALAVATATFTGTALAGGGHGNGNGNGNGGGQDTAQTQQSQPQAGVKPSSTTDHWTHTTVGANPDVSKRYGNGTTAAEIAKSRGAPDSQPLTGPGNSQPHKTYDCRHKNNKSGGVDVHAIKSYSSTSCTSSDTSQEHTTPVHTTPVHTTPVHTTPVHTTPVPTTPTTTTPSRHEEHKVTLCHATGSATNPYVMITVDYHALKNGHTAAKGDIIPPTTINGVTYSGNWDAAGQAIFNNGCRPVAQQAPATTATTTTTTPTVTTTPAITTTTTPTLTQVTTTTQTGAVSPTTTTVTVTNTTTTQPVQTQTVTTTQTTQLAPVTTTETTTTQAQAGGVAGAHTTLTTPKKSSGGVIGTVSNVAGGTLPFTGFPVWLAVLIAVALILAGIALRRRSYGPTV